MMKKIGVLYLSPEHFQSEAAQTIGAPLVGPNLEQIFRNRRAVDGRLTPLGYQMQRATIAYFKANYGIDVVLRWSRKAGCSMCPCSPGFVIKSAQARYYGRLGKKYGAQEFNVWVEGNKLDPRPPSSEYRYPFPINEHALVGTA